MARQIREAVQGLFRTSPAIVLRLSNAVCWGWRIHPCVFSARRTHSARKMTHQRPFLSHAGGLDAQKALDRLDFAFAPPKKGRS